MKYQLHTDHHFVIGHMHLSDGRPCQDHALSGLVKGDLHRDETIMAYAVVSDGCSNLRNPGETDIGARLLTTLSAKRFRETYHVGDELYIEADAMEAADMLGLEQNDLFATHLYAVIDRDGEGQVVVKGDGAVAFLWRDGQITVYKFEWANNLPFYPLYNGLDDFYKAHGGQEAQALTASCWSLIDGEFVKGSEATYSVDEGCEGIKLPIIGNADLSAICLFSDGVNQVDKIDWTNTVKQLTAFKNRAGTFAKRRMIHFIKDSMKLGHGPLDDLSIAVISIEPDEDQSDV